MRKIKILVVLFCVILFTANSNAQENAPLRRPISPEQPMWLVHIDTWNWADPQKIIDLIPDDIRPFVVMNISLSISHDQATSRFKVAEYGYEIAKSWVRTCAENQMWATVQLSSGGYAQFSDFDLSIYEEFYRDYPNLIGFNYAEQFWGYDDPNDPLSAKWIDRMAHFADMLELSNKYGGYLIVSMCWNQWGPSINPIGQMKRSPDFATACEKYTENYILCEKYTQQAYLSDMESICLGAYLSGYSGQYGLRYDDTGWTDANGNGENFTMATEGAVQLEHVMLTGQTVFDGPELIWTQCFRETGRQSTTDGYTKRNWETFPQFDNVSVDIFRKIVDGTVRIPSRQEVIDRTKYVIVNNVNDGTDDDKYSSPTSLFQGLYRMDMDGNLRDNKYFFKKTGRYPTIPVVYALDDTATSSFEYIVNKSDYSSRWSSVSSKTTEFNDQFPSEYTGDLYAGRLENGWVTYNPYKTDKTATSIIPFKYNTCDSMELSYSQYTAGVVKEYADSVTFYLSNFDNELNTSLKTDVIKIYGSTDEPSYTITERGDHKASEISSSWDNGVFTLTIDHNGPLDINMDCAGTATGRLTSYTEASIVTPKAPPAYTGLHQYEGECFDYKNVADVRTNGYDGSIRNYTGQGYLQFGTNSLASVRDIVTLSASGVYELMTRYRAADGDVSNIDLYINGVKISTPVFVKTSVYSDWSINTQEIILNAGENVIEFKANSAGSSNIYIDNIVIGPETDYSFTNDIATTNAENPPASYIGLLSGSAGIVSYVNSSNDTTNCLKAYSVGPTNGTAVTNLDRFGNSSDYSITWKEYIETTGGIKGMLLRATGDTSSCNYAQGLKQGYLFTVTNNIDNTVTLTSYLAQPDGIIEKSTYTSTFNVNPGEPYWYRASATGNTLMFECSEDSLSWEGNGSTTFTDETYTIGKSQFVWGFDSDSLNWYIDNIAYLSGEVSLAEPTISGLTYLAEVGSSPGQLIHVQGQSLIGDVKVEVTGNFEITNNLDSTYSSVLTLPKTGDMVDTSIYIRLKPGLDIGSYIGSIMLSSTGVEMKTYTLFGSVLNDLIYNFDLDDESTNSGIQPALNMTIGTGNGATAGVDDIRFSIGGTSNSFTAYSGGERKSTGVANLDLFPKDSVNYMVTWKQTIGTSDENYKIGMLLRGNDLPEGELGYVNGIMQGYVFSVYYAGSLSTPRTDFIIYKSSGETSLEKLVKNSINELVPKARQTTWFRASVNGTTSTECKFEYSPDSINWLTAASYTDETTTYSSGATQLIWGFGVANWDFYTDNIAFGPYVEISSLAVSTDELKGFSYSMNQGPSEIQSFKVQANYLDQDVEVTAPDDYEISTSEDTDFGSYLLLSGNDLITVYVRLKNGLSVGKYNDEPLTIETVGYDTKTILLNGYVKTASGINDSKSPTAFVVSKEYYTILGQVIQSIPEKSGIYIVKTHMSDNTVLVTKEWIERD